MKFNAAKSATIVVTAGLLTGCGVTLQKHDTTDSRRGYDILVPGRAPKRVMGDRGVVPKPFEEPADFAVNNSFNADPVGNVGEGTLPAFDDGASVQINDGGLDTVGEPPIIPPKDDEPVAPKKLTYRTKKGDSLWKIGRMYGVSMQELAAENGMTLDQKLKVGKVLTIPAGGKLQPESKWKVRRKKKAPSKAKAPAGTSVRSKGPKKSGTSYKPRGKEPIPVNGKYTVKSGDSLWKISHRFGVSIDDIMKLNGLKKQVLQPGMVLVLKGGASAAPARTVKKADPVVKKNPDPVVKKADPVVKKADPVVKKADPVVKPSGGVAAGNGGGIKVEQPEKVVPDNQFMTHVLEEYDKLEDLAEIYAVSTQAIKDANPNIDWNNIPVGTEIKIPMGK